MKKGLVFANLTALALAVLLAAGGVFYGLRQRRALKEAAALLAQSQAAQQAAEQMESELRTELEQARRQADEAAQALADAQIVLDRQARMMADAQKSAVRQGDAIGRVYVEGTAVDCDIYWGDTQQIFDWGAGCHITDGCVLPGENGTVFIGAHTGTFFEDLKSAETGSIIHLETPWGNFLYRITETRVIYETEIDQCRWGDTEPNCILYTCYPFGILTPTDRRYLVYAEPLQTDAYGVVPAGT